MKDQNVFKQKLYQHTMPVPDNLWNRIEAKLPADKKRFPFLWMFFASGLLLAGAFILWSNNKETSIEKSFPAENNSVTEISSSANNSFKTNSSTNIPVNDLTSNSTANNNSKTEESSYSKSANGSSSNQLDPKLRDRTASKSSVSSISTIPHNNLLSEQSESTTTNEIVSHGFVRSIRKTEALALTPDLLLAETGFPAGMSKIKPDPSCYKFTGDNGKSPLSVDFFAGPGFSPRSFESTGGESPLYMQARQATERSQYAWAGGARVNYSLKEDLGLSVGILYEQIGDIFDYRDTSAFQSSLRVDSFFSANGQFLYADTSYVLTFGTLIKKIHNRYHHVDIPLLVSYQLPMGRATLMVNAGPVINLTTNYRGQILDPTLTPRHITPGTKNTLKAYKNSLGISLYIGAGALFPLSENISALIEPRFLYRIKPVTLDGYPLKEHRHYAGLNLGFRYHFN